MELYDISTICSYDMKDFVFTLNGAHTDNWLILASSPQMYQEYYAGQDGVPLLRAPEGGWRPDFPPPWANG